MDSAPSAASAPPAASAPHAASPAPAPAALARVTFLEVGTIKDRPVFISVSGRPYGIHHGPAVEVRFAADADGSPFPKTRDKLLLISWKPEISKILTKKGLDKPSAKRKEEYRKDMMKTCLLRWFRRQTGVHEDENEESSDDDPDLAVLCSGIPNDATDSSDDDRN